MDKKAKQLIKEFKVSKMNLKKAGIIEKIKNWWEKRVERKKGQTEEERRKELEHSKREM